MATTKHTFLDIFGTDFSVGEEQVRLNKIIIPIIQRDYAQGRSGDDIPRVRSRFLDSLYKAATDKPITLDFVYGDINTDGIMTPLDGQQRLTTLFLLHWYAAKKERIDKSEYEFLHGFSYETRYSARDFCTYLVDYDPGFETAISEEIIDQPWFPLDWMKDATISAMLVMLDDIQKKFSDVSNLWQALKDKRISFYFLPIKDMGLTDELYIKMNSRGKPLTIFEHFKAELEHELKQVNEDTCKRIMRKIDIDWTDMLWEYRGDDNVTDDEFLRYFRFICDIICYKDGGTMQGKKPSEFDLLDDFFASKNENAERNVLIMERFFDVWKKEELNESPTEFLNRFISVEHEDGKIKIDKDPDIFNDCLRNYADILGGRNRAFPLNRIILLYAVVDYLMHKDSITEGQFSRRFRIVQNLTRNSEDEVSDSETRSSGNRMPAILRQVDSIIEKGIIDESIENNFNTYQLSEEKEKIKWIENNPQYASELFALEDQELLYGQVAIIGLENPSLFGKFEKLFRCSKDAIDCAMLTIDDYTQVDKNGWRYQIGSGKVVRAWTNLFHNRAASGFENTKNALIRLLFVDRDYTDDVLYGIADDYIKDCENKHIYDWRYYYLKYKDVFRPYRYGRIYWENKEEKPYEMIILHAELYVSENSYQPFLKCIDGEAVSRDDLGKFLIVGDCRIECANDSFILRNINDESIKDTLVIRQNADGIDTEDRIIQGIQWYSQYK